VISFYSLQNRSETILRLIFIFLLTSSCLNPSLKAFSQVDPKFWNLKFKTLENDSLSMKSFKGQYLLINFWGEWCGTCIEEIPFLIKQNLKYGTGPLKMVSFLKVVHETKAKNLIRKNAIAWPQIPLSEQVEKIFAIKKFPTNLLISPIGEIVMNGFHMNYQDFKKRMGDTNSISIIQKNDITKDKK